MTVIDAATDETAWTLFEEGVRPMAFETNADGSTKRIFVQLSNIHGFAVVDFAQKKEVARVMLPDDVPADKVDKGPFNASPSHGLGVAPDGKTLWVTSRPNAKVYVYSLPDLTLLGSADLGGRARLGHLHARQQAGLHRHREPRRDRRARRRHTPGGVEDPGRQGAEAHHHGDDAVSSGFRLPALTACRGARSGNRPAHRPRRAEASRRTPPSSAPRRATAPGCSSP